MKNKAIVFFSRNGSTKIAAELLAERVQADLIELEEVKAVKGFLRSGYMASRKKGSPLANDPWKRCADKDTLILGTPVWASNGTPAMNSFLEGADFKGKKVYLFILMADPRFKGSDKVFSYIKERVIEKGGELVSTHVVHGASPGKTASVDQLKEAMKSWEIPS